MTGLWFLHSAIPLTVSISVYQVSINSFVSFQRYAPDKLFMAKIKKGSNSVNTGDKVMILALCTSSDGPLSMYQVAFNALIYCQRYALDKLFIAKIKKGSNSINTVDRGIKFHLIPLYMLQRSFSLQKREVTPYIL